MKEIMSEKDYLLLETLLKQTQGQIKYLLEKFLKKQYKNIIITKDYIVAIGDIPIALVAHMDTVFQEPRDINLLYDSRKNIMIAPNGAGFDDRAGIFAILKILQSGLRPSVIFTTDEEEGGLGASVLALCECPIPNLKYMIELDRRGSNDCVFYDCDCPEFIEYVESFGFQEQWGSFSDISFLMPEWKICGVNLSVGYEDEHSISETLNVNFLFNTIEKVKMMLQVKDIPNFTYSEFNYYDSIWWKNRTLFGQHCTQCKQFYPEYELFPVKGRNKQMKYYCSDCIADANKVNWCNICGSAYEILDPTQASVCPDCANYGEVLCTTTLKNSLNP